MSEDLFFAVHQDIPREGPGDNESTKKAFQLLPDLPARPQILDIGCGPGMQTIQLAKLTDGSITAIDTHEPFLRELDRRKAAEGVAGKIRTMRASMFALPFPEESLDVIWAEGSIFIIGFERGLREWKRLLTPNGYLVVSELSWLKESPPAEIVDYWAENYPAIKTVEENKKVVTQSGYTLIDSFPLPESAWWQDYYTPLEQRLALLREQYAGREEMVSRLAPIQREIDMYRQYSSYYGYTFFVMQAK